MPEKSPIEKLQESVTAAVRGVAADPVGSAGKAAEQVRGLLSLGLTVAGQVAQTVAERLQQASPPPSAPQRPVVPPASAVPTPADVAEVVEMRPKPRPPVKKATAKKAPPRKAPAPKATPSGKLPAKKSAPTTAAKPAPPATKAAAKKAPAKKAPAKKAPAKKTPVAKKPAKSVPPKTAAEVVEDAELPTPIESIGTSFGDGASSED